MNTSIDKYRALLQAVECGSITKAAEVLQYSHSAVSRMIQSLEEEWNVVLLERSKQGVTPTSDGIKLMPFVRRLCGDHDQLQMQVDEINGLEAGIIRIATFSSVSTYWLPRIITAFHEDYPNIEYEILLGDYDEIEEWVRNGRVDCAFIRLPAAPDLDAILLDSDEFFAVLPEDHPLSNADDFPIEEAEYYPFLMLDKNDNMNIRDYFREHDVHPEVRVTTWDDYSIMALVEQGFGISILPGLILQRIPYKIIRKKLAAPLYRQIGLAARDWETATLAVRTFREYTESLLLRY